MSRNGKSHNHLRELKWSELISRQDAYRFYIKLILGVNGFFYATTGAVLLFYFGQNNNHWEWFFMPPPTDNHYREFFLLLPILMGTVLGGFLIYARALQQHNSEIIEHIRLELHAEYHMEIQLIPDVNLLDRLLLVFGTLFFIVAGSINLVLLRSRNWLLLGAGLGIVIVGLIVSWKKRSRYLDSTKEERLRLNQLIEELLLDVGEKRKNRDKR